MPRPPLLLPVVWAVSVLAITLGLGSLNWPTLRDLSARGVRTEGWVLALPPHQHATADYEYAVGGQSFRGRHQPAPPNPPPERLSVGQPLTVTYDPRRPAASFPGDPRPALHNEALTVALAAILMPLFITFAVARAWHRRRAPVHRPA